MYEILASVDVMQSPKLVCGIKAFNAPISPLRIPLGTGDLTAYYNILFPPHWGIWQHCHVTHVKSL